MATKIRNGIQVIRKPTKLNGTIVLGEISSRVDLPDELAAKEHPEAQSDHIVGRFAVVAHRIQGHGYMRMTIITAEVVLNRSSWQRSGRFGHG